MRKQTIITIVTSLILPLAFLAHAFAEIAKIGEYSVVNKDTYGAFSKENIKKMTSLILSKDQAALNLLISEGMVFPVKKGTRVFLEDASVWQGLAKVRPEGRIDSIWVYYHDLSPENIPAESNNQETATDNKSGTYKIEGIAFNKDKPTVIINGQNYFLQDSVSGVKIIGISPDSIIIEQDGKFKVLEIGDSF